MSDSRVRLINCFSTVFPELTQAEIVRAHSQEVGDSLSWITLLSVIQEEFGVELDVDFADDSLSCDALLEQLSRPKVV